jgi:hypothetical protein
MQSPTLSVVLAGVLVAATAVPAAAVWECSEAAALPADCGLATCTDDTVQTIDALRALKAAVGSAYCATCRCDVDASGVITASDASRILRSAVGQQVELACSSCNSLTLELLEQPSADDLAAISIGGNGTSERSASVASYEFWTPLSTTPLSDGRTAIIGRNKFSGGTHLILKDAEGAVLSTNILFENVWTDGRMTCAAGSTRCVLSWQNWLPGEHTLRMGVLDVDSPQTLDSIVVKEVVEEGEGDIEITTGAGAYKFACDHSGICVVAWALRRTTIEDQHFEDSEVLSFSARGFNVHTGEAGPELFLDYAESDDHFTYPEVAALGENRFSITIGATVREYEVR